MESIWKCKLSLHRTRTDIYLLFSMYSITTVCLVYVHTILACRRLRQGDCKWKASLGYKLNTCLKKLTSSQAGWHTLLSPGLGRERQAGLCVRLSLSTEQVLGHPELQSETWFKYMSLSVFLAGMGQALSLMIFRSTKIKNNSYKAFVLGVGSNLKMAFSTLYTGYVQILYKRLE